jgi:hypothetical protein
VSLLLTLSALVVAVLDVAAAELDCSPSVLDDVLAASDEDDELLLSLADEDDTISRLLLELAELSELEEELVSGTLVEASAAKLCTGFNCKPTHKDIVVIKPNVQNFPVLYIL